MAFVNVAAGIVTLRYLAAPTTADSGSMIQSVIALGKYSNNNALLHYILLFPNLRFKMFTFKLFVIYFKMI